MLFDRSYIGATRHPAMSGMFVLTLLLGYEVSVLCCRQGDDLPWRAGLDAGWRFQLRQWGKRWLEWVPCISIAVGLTVWPMFRWNDRPREWFGTLAGMVLESFLLALPLLALGRALGMMTTSMSGSPNNPEQRWASLIASLGAGVYEEIVFRLVLVSLLLALGRLLGLGKVVRLLLALLVSGALFALAHHIPPFDEPYRLELLLFRFLAGAYFGLIYRFRGLGIAVGTHAGYDLLASAY